MSTSDRATATVAAIRSLKERATIYRAISAHTATLAGVLSIAYAAWTWLDTSYESSDRLGFIAGWMLICAFILVVNTVVLRNEAWRRGDPFVSPGMLLALRGVIPPLVAGAAVTLMLPGLPLLVSLWMLFYGLALLSTQEFAPASIQCLGRTFVGAGILSGLIWSLLSTQYHPVRYAAAAMGLSFGLLHLAYGLYARRSVAGEQPAGE